MFVLSSQLRSFKSILKKWNKDTCDNIHLEITQTIDDVIGIQSLINDRNS